VGCVSCQSGFWFYQGVCYSACPSGTVGGNNSNWNCVPDPCLYYNSSAGGGCLSCVSPYVVVTNASGYSSCALNCPSGTVMSSGSCLPCPTNCLSCLSQTSCQICNNYTFLYQGTCRYLCPVGTFPVQSSCQACNIPFCLQCSSSSNCSACDFSSGASLSNGSCVVNCPVGTYPDSHVNQCLNCSQGCLSCTNGSACTVCIAGYNLIGGQCSMSCPNGTYISATGACLSCGPGCAYCLSASNCSLCQSGYSLFVSSGAGSCVAFCPSGYYSASVLSWIYSNSNSYSCLPCIAPCLTCSTTGSSCTSCVANYSLTGSSCTTSCGAGYYPIVQINSGQVSEVTICYPCSPICVTCTSWSTCTSCAAGMILDAQGDCLSGCASPSMYYDSTTRQCLYCSSACYMCDGPLSSDCLACSPPLQLFQGSCVTNCPFGYYATASYICQPCEISCASCFGSASNCTVCPVNTFLLNGTAGSYCSSSCGSGFYLNGTLGICQPCHLSCANCTGPAINQCSSCQTGALLWQGLCIAFCPNGTALVQTATMSSCQSCPSNCLNCTSTSSYGLNCTLCVSPLFLINGSCLQNCPVGTYKSLSSLSCISCSIPGCQTCIFNTSW
jgi:proprotein convertase subtilisin/kexin type 5